MRTEQQWRLYQELEEIPMAPLERPRSFRQALIRFSKALHALSLSLSGISQVREVTNDRGEVYWLVYDSKRDCTLEFETEQEVLVWLDEDHYSPKSSY